MTPARLLAFRTYVGDFAARFSVPAISEIVDELVAHVETLQAAIRKHRDQGGDDRCWEDDDSLYAVLPEPNPRRVNDCSPERMLENCKRYIASRHDPSTPYVSPQREIERLSDALALVAGATTGPINDTLRWSIHVVACRAAGMEPITATAEVIREASLRCPSCGGDPAAFCCVEPRECLYCEGRDPRYAAPELWCRAEAKPGTEPARCAAHEGRR